MKVKSGSLQVIYDSLGGQTVQAEVNGSAAACPGGTSKSRHEAKVLPVEDSLRAFEKVKKEFTGSFDQLTFDAALKRRMDMLGARVTTALSLAFYSADNPKPLQSFPNLLGNVVGGGSHGAKSQLNIQEILVIPRKAKTLDEAIETNFHIWHEVGERLKKKGFAALNYEGAWAANLQNETALNIVAEVARWHDAELGIDLAASTMIKKEWYQWSDHPRTRGEHIDYVKRLIDTYKLVYVEDPLHEEDFEGFAELNAKTKALICADDLVATHPDRFERAVKKDCAKAVIVKPNQIGNVSDCISIIETSKRGKIVPVVSHRSRETPDTSVCKLAQLAPLAKFGIAGMRTIKLNGLLNLWHAAEKPRLTRLSF